MCSAAGVASPGTPFKVVERLEDLTRPQAALAVLQARQGSSSGALPASHGLEAARIGMRLLLQCGLLPEAYAEVSCGSLPAAAFLHSWTQKDARDFQNACQVNQSTNCLTIQLLRLCPEIIRSCR